MGICGTCIAPQPVANGARALRVWDDVRSKKIESRLGLHIAVVPPRRYRFTALLALKIRSPQMILLQGEAHFDVPQYQAQSLQKSGKEQPAPMAPALILEYSALRDLEDIIHKCHPVLNQIMIYDWNQTCFHRGCNSWHPATSSRLI